MPWNPFLHIDCFRTLRIHTSHHLGLLPTCHVDPWVILKTRSIIPGGIRVNPDHDSLQMRRFGHKPELFFTPTIIAGAAYASMLSSPLIHTGPSLSLGIWQTLSEIHCVVPECIGGFGSGCLCGLNTSQCFSAKAILESSVLLTCNVNEIQCSLAFSFLRANASDLLLDLDS